MKDVKIFVSHWPKLADRRKNLEAALSQLGLQAEWVTQFDRDHLPPNLEFEYYSDSIDLFNHRAAGGGFFKQPLAYRRLSPVEIANALTHISCFEKMVREEIETAMILEDDIVFFPDFDRRLQEYLNQLPSNWDILYPGSGCGLRVPDPIATQNVYLNPMSFSRTADCYVIKRKAAEKLLSTMIPFTLPIDWELNYHQKLHGLQVYWGEPSLAAQGSEVGLFATSVPERG